MRTYLKELEINILQHMLKTLLKILTGVLILTLNEVDHFFASL